ncbi:MAG: hypothetical protein H6875_09075 [Hyphomicrobiaceae bacterium]|nr:hypothetical protein [Hyphomicrobiaceae bacterium]
MRPNKKLARLSHEGSTVNHRYAFRLPPCGSISRQRDDGRALVRKAG